MCQNADKIDAAVLVPLKRLLSEIVADRLGLKNPGLCPSTYTQDQTSLPSAHSKPQAAVPIAGDSAASWSPFLQDDLSVPLTEEDLDGSSGVLFPFYDSDTNMLYVVGKVSLSGSGGRWQPGAPGDREQWLATFPNREACTLPHTPSSLGRLGPGLCLVTPCLCFQALGPGSLSPQAILNLGRAGLHRARLSRSWHLWPLPPNILSIF